MKSKNQKRSLVYTGPTAEKSTVEGDSFVFSDDIEKWMRGKTLSKNKTYQRAPNRF
jgi:hypothetical protein